MRFNALLKIWDKWQSLGPKHVIDIYHTMAKNGMYIWAKENCYSQGCFKSL